MAKVLVVLSLELGKLSLLDRFQIEKCEHIVVCESGQVAKADFDCITGVDSRFTIFFCFIVAICSYLPFHEISNRTINWD